MRILDSTAFYIKLILQTFIDIGPFFMIFPIFLATFGTPIFILSDGRADGNEVISEYIGFGLLDTIFNQYLLALGEFDSLETFGGKYDSIIILLFVLATFCTCVTALNMIIAIMSDTFTSVSDHREQHKREMKLELLSDYTLLVRNITARTIDYFTNILIQGEKGLRSMVPEDSFLILVTA